MGAANTTNRTTTIRNTKASSTAKAIVGRTTYTGGALNAAGVQGLADGRHATGVWGEANRGVDATGVYGASDTGTGVWGIGPIGVSGIGGFGVFGGSAVTDGTGVMGVAADECLDGVTGISESTDGNGVMGTADVGPDAAGIYGASFTGYAGWFDGDVNITGELFVPTAFTQVDHPTDPGGRWFRQALVGSLERVTVISGNAVTGANGRVVVRVPRVFGAAHRDVRYQLTAIGRAASPWIARELADGRFVIDAGAGGVRVSWQLTGVRSDPGSRDGRFETEPRKRAADRGRYLAPDAFGVPASRRLRRRAGRIQAPRRPDPKRRDAAAD